MKWLSGAQSEALKAEQAKAAGVRREERITARREVMAQPVYRAWMFLTGKMQEGDRLPSDKVKFSAEVDRVRACDAALQSVIDGGALVSFAAGLRSVDGLAIARYRAERNGETGESVKITMELRKVRLATTARAPVPLVRRAQVRLDRGAQPADNRTFGARFADTGPARAFAEALGAS